MSISFTFTQEERLKSKKMIGALFAGGNSYMAYPIRVVWLPFPPDFHTPPTVPVQMTVTASKRVFKTATARNRIKRLVREAWRLHKHEFYARRGPDAPPIALLLMYVAKEEVSFLEVEKGVRKMIAKFEEPIK